MSVATPPAPPAPAAEQGVGTAAGSQQRKSYRRKYRKIMVKFEERMQESNGLFRDEQRIFDISQRLAEQTDQMLQLLLELNNRPQVPSSLRFDLRPSLSSKSTSKTDRHQDREAIHENLRVARDRVQKGEIRPFDYEQLQEEILDNPEFASSKSYASIFKILDLPTPRALLADTNSLPALGALSIRQEEQYLQSLDDYLDGKTSTARSHTSKSLGSRTTEKSADRERETQLRNPVSVYNWLRKHQPQVFLQDHESTSGDKAGKSSASRSSKRTAGRDVKQEQEYYDEDGFAVDQANSAKGKRKREEDTAFRPKGGRSGHSSKRRKEDSGGKRSKRSSLDARNV